jgi:dTDP-4-dehydrorhamnose 3,5-epimerase
MSFEFRETDIADVKVIVPKVFEDDRGLFMETYVRESFLAAGIDAEFVQDNYSVSEASVLRGLHYQHGDAAQGKLVQCTGGVIFDVAVDLRTDSPTFGESVSMILSEHNRKMLWIPRGFAHGFLTLSRTAEVRYKLDNEYAPDREAGIYWDDPSLGVDWPVDDPILADKDTDWPTVQQAVKEDLVF